MGIENIDLSGVTGVINYRYDNAVTIIPSIVQSVISLIIVGLLVLLIIVAFQKLFPKSKQYRELLSDMYVIGMIRKFAEQDKISLNEELKKFSTIIKKSEIYTKSIDVVIENEMKEKIVNEVEKKIAKDGK